MRLNCDLKLVQWLRSVVVLCTLQRAPGSRSITPNSIHPISNRKFKKKVSVALSQDSQANPVLSFWTTTRSVEIAGQINCKWQARMGASCSARISISAHRRSQTKTWSCPPLRAVSERTSYSSHLSPPAFACHSRIAISSNIAEFGFTKSSNKVLRGH